MTTRSTLRRAARRFGIFAAIIAIGLLMLTLLAILDSQAAHGQDEPPAKLIPPISFVRGPGGVAVPLPASRSFLRPPLSDTPADTGPADPAAGGTQTSPGGSAVSGRPATTTSPSAVPARSVATRSPVTSTVGDKPGDAEDVTGPTAAQWAKLRACESGYLGYRANTGNGYYGAYQFDLPTWRSNGGVGRPDLATPAEQDRVAQVLYSRRGAQPWPVCGKWLR